MARSDLRPSNAEDFWDLTLTREPTVIHAVANSVQPMVVPPVGACTYPARPVNGGSLELALPKAGQWYYEPKYNGWRALVHAPSGTMFNRYGARLSIAGEFATALGALQKIRLLSPAGTVEWYDCEALERRHGLGRGTLLVFDYVQAGNKEPYLERNTKLSRVLPVHAHGEPPEPERVYAVASAPGTLSPSEFYQALRQLNRHWRCTFYEGLVAKRADSRYPVQLRSPALEFAGWVKHRWSR
jgi:ATP-dependent DNA ligase